MNNSDFTISIDGMGGDKAPESVIAGIGLAHKIYPNVKFNIYGDSSKILPILEKIKDYQSFVKLLHTKSRVMPDEKPSHAVRNSRDSSMSLAIESVKSGEASAVISSGNTGALMALAKLSLRTLPSINRPAIVTMLPTKTGKVVMLDLGANSECSSENLLQFAIMGDAYAKIHLNIEKPKIGLLNIGTEDVKGNETLKSTWQALTNAKDLNFIGFVEGDDISKGTVDVVVTDGFTGNVALKAIEGMASMCSNYLRTALSSSIFAKIGFLLAKPALTKMYKSIDPREYNGAMFVGLNGIVVKSHGSADEYSFASAIKTAIELINNDINDKITQELELTGFATENAIKRIVKAFTNA